LTNKVLIVNSDADWFAEQLCGKFPALSFHATQTPEQAIDVVEDADILVGLAPDLSEPLLASMPQLKWVHALTTGVDNLVVSSVLSPDVYLSNSSGFHGPQMSELAIMLMLSTVRDLPRMLENQKAKNWQRWPQPLLKGKTACVVGLGSIAEALATRLLGFGMKLTGVSDGRSGAPGYSKVYPRTKLADAASEADFLIVLVPYSPSTHHLVDDSVFAVMRPGSILINIARGGCVDEEALQRHMRAGTIGAAALDVFAEEPLPSHNSLWDTPGLIITPHIGGMSNTYREQVLPIVINNLKAWAEGGGETLPNRVRREG
jgi:D-2-hydroxyacid dehydrogenase (NADP+)